MTIVTEKINVINANQVAKLLGVSASHVYKLAKGEVARSATLPSHKTGNRYWFDEKEVKEWGIKQHFIKSNLKEVAETSLEEKVKKGIAKVNTKLIVRPDKIRLLSESIRKRDPHEIIKVKGCNLLIYEENGSGILNSRQSRSGKHCFVSQKVIDTAIPYVNNGYDIIHRQLNREGVVTYEEGLDISVYRLQSLGFNPINGPAGSYYLITLGGYWIES